jgi:Beta-lactamase
MGESMDKLCYDGFIVLGAGSISIAVASFDLKITIPCYFSKLEVNHAQVIPGGVSYLFDEAYYTLLAERAHDLLNDEVAVEDFLSLMKGRELDFVPGTSFRYSNGGYFLLGRIIEVVSGLTYPEFIASAITGPLEMHHTGYLDSIAIVPGRTRSYLDDEGGYINNPYAFLAANCTYAAGGLESTVEDLVRFAQALQSGELLTVESTGRMFETRTTDLLPASRQFGLGSWIGSLKHRRMVWHGGDVYGFSGTMVGWPDDGIYVAILTSNPYVSSADLDVLARQAAAILLGDPFPPRVRVTLTAEQKDRLCGVYQVPDGPVREVSVVEGRLYIQRNGGRKIEAIPAAAARFFFEHSLSYVTFERDENGRIAGLVMHRDSGEKETAWRPPAD